MNSRKPLAAQTSHYLTKLCVKSSLLSFVLYVLFVTYYTLKHYLGDFLLLSTDCSIIELTELYSWDQTQRSNCPFSWLALTAGHQTRSWTPLGESTDVFEGSAWDEISWRHGRSVVSSVVQELCFYLKHSTKVWMLKQWGETWKKVEGCTARGEETNAERGKMSGLEKVWRRHVCRGVVIDSDASRLEKEEEKKIKDTVTEVGLSPVCNSNLCTELMKVPDNGNIKNWGEHGPFLRGIPHHHVMHRIFIPQPLVNAELSGSSVNLEYF